MISPKASVGLARVLLTFILATVASASADVRMPGYSPEWAAVEKAFQPIGLDGTPGVRYSIIEDPVLAALGIMPTWVHDIDLDADHRPRSQWQLTGLKSYLILSGSDHWLWQLPDGRRVRFARDLVGPARSSAGAAAVWQIRELGSGRFELSAIDGLRWVYQGGQLSSIHHPILGTYQVESEGAWLRKLTPLAAGVSGDPVLRLDLDEWGQPVRLSSGEEKAHAFEWSETGQLLSWKNNNSEPRIFEYKEGLLQSIVDADGEGERFGWEEHPGWWRGDSRWPAPVYLSFTDERMFRMSVSQKGYRIEVHDESGEETVLVFNPQRRRLDFWANGVQRHFHFRRSGAGMGLLERVEDDDGQMLERWIYGNDGRLLQVERGNEVQKVGYDSLGRMVKVETVEREQYTNED